MATEKDLVNAVRESLKADGDLDRIKAEMRTEVIKLLDGSSKESKLKTVNPSHDIVFLNELIREYLDWMGYKYSSTVFTAECDLPKHPLDRTLLAQGLGVRDNEKSKTLPLLCSLVQTFASLKTS
ncbi:lisH domain-containing protein FOPNL [Pseudomyrmex gracilis]|uniref:lisH domain-containing protein FOPNL n=1 Tax=Pseudomyrmex gracilis TaxID=219809 RepID=UPI00099577BF|nr:lisH domain-containing protein FOPNL [Pseudomyrmex gracilis]XP_020290566.1 lisH domain-containing protein FOPNL [Pseudomyrmex gracilis]XP_020290567.1 lisH domain-containing protein FOPNL [Pseudomyrmex gracilis]